MDIVFGQVSTSITDDNGNMIRLSADDLDDLAGMLAGREPTRAGVIVVDRDNDRWVRDNGDPLWSPVEPISNPRTWADLVDRFGPISRLASGQ